VAHDKKWTDYVSGAPCARSMSPGTLRPVLAGGAGRGRVRAHVLRLSPAVLQPPNAGVSMNRAPSAVHRCELFGLYLYPMRPLGHGAGTPPLLGPPWLPYPPARETHEARHARRRAAVAARARVPLLPVAVLISKKRVHKHAVVRNRCRTRLMAALQAVAREGAIPVVPGALSY